MEETKKQLFVRGMKDGIPIGLGYFAVSFTLGIAAKNAGIEDTKDYYYYYFHTFPFTDYTSST